MKTNYLTSLTRFSAIALMVCSLTQRALATEPASSSTTVPYNGGCPGGSTSVGNGYCSSTDGRPFMPYNGGCPGGSTAAGNDYCRADNPSDVFIPYNGGCPSGFTAAGNGYCRKE